MFKFIFTCFIFLAYGYILLVSSLDEDSLEPLTLRILGGYDAPARLAPYQVSLRNLANFHFCGGAILNKRWVLTAAHCTIGRSSNSTNVVVGTHNRTVGGDLYTTSSIINHENFNISSLANDLSLIRVHEEIQFNDHVQPIQLPDKDTGAGEKVTLTGWGLTAYPGRPSETLQVINLKTVSVETCQKSFRGINSSQICTFDKIGEGACVGDSGGPLVFNGSIVGVVSFGKPCARGYPDVFSRVYFFKEWILTKISAPI